MPKLTEIAEDYLEAIYTLGKTKKIVRVKDIARQLNVKMASVVVGLKSLAEKGLVEHEHYGYVELTPAGEEIAKKIHYRHQLLFKFLHEILGLPSAIADRDACRIEHYLSQEGLERILKFIEFIKACPDGAPIWLTNFYYFLEYGSFPETGLKKAKGPLLTLAQIEANKRVEVIKFGGEVEFRQSLLRKGIVPGAILLVEEKTPKIIKVKFNGNSISFSPSEAKHIFVTPLP